MDLRVKIYIWEESYWHWFSKSIIDKGIHILYFEEERFSMFYDWKMYGRNFLNSLKYTFHMSMYWEISTCADVCPYVVRGHISVYLWSIRFHTWIWYSLSLPIFDVCDLEYICRILQENGLTITIEANVKSVNFPYVNFNLETEIIQPYMKPNDTPLHSISTLRATTLQVF